MDLDNNELFSMGHLLVSPLNRKNCQLLNIIIYEMISRIDVLIIYDSFSFFVDKLLKGIHYN